MRAFGLLFLLAGCLLLMLGVIALVLTRHHTSR